MKLYALSVFALALGGSILVAGDCADCAGASAGRRVGLFARRAERRASRGACESAAATAQVESVQPAEIKTTTTYKTTKVGEKVTIVPTGSAKTVVPQASK